MSGSNSFFIGEKLTCLRAERLVFARLSFKLGAGETLILRGPNGSGKSSLLRLLTGLSRPESGELTWDDMPIRDDMATHRARLHFIGHLDAAKPALGVEEMLNFWAGMRGGVENVGAALAYFRLSRLAQFPCRLLSAGEKKRLALARLIASPADLWLLDEPTTGLDAAAEADLMQAIGDFRSTGGRLVVATHASLELPDAVTLSLGDYAPKAKAA